jgi:hypothetical protein
MADIVKISLVLGVRDFDTAINTTSGFAMFFSAFPNLEALSLRAD